MKGREKLLVNGSVRWCVRVSVHDRRSVGRERVVAVFTCPPSLVKEAGMTVSRAGEHAHTPHMYVPAHACLHLCVTALARASPTC